jgi:hypothetical protein
MKKTMKNLILGSLTVLILAGGASLLSTDGNSDLAAKHTITPDSWQNA